VRSAGRDRRDTRDVDDTSTKDQTLADTISRSARGDAEAFGRLYDLYADRVSRYAAYLSGNRTEAEDLTADIFIKVRHKLPTFRGSQDAFLSWLLRLTHNHVIDYLRRQRRDAVLLLSEFETDDIIPGEEDTQDSTERSLMSREVLRMLKYLPPLQRQAVILKFIEELSNREISRITGQSEGAIRIAQMRGLQTLRAALDCR
jgi:RNA polymerase sigma-70 factor (ECF subfamily)